MQSIRSVYTDLIISTIVDSFFYSHLHRVYTDLIISTIVDVIRSSMSFCVVYTDLIISTIVDFNVSD